MTCEKIQTELPGYVIDRIPASERATIDGHLRTCLVCRADVASLEQLERALEAALTPVSLSPALEARFAARLAAEIERESEAHPFRRWLESWWTPAALAGGAVAAVALIWALGSGSPAPRELAKAPAAPKPAAVIAVVPVAPPVAAPAPIAVADAVTKPVRAPLPPELEEEPEMFVDFAIIEELEVIQELEGMAQGKTG